MTLTATTTVLESGEAPSVSVGVRVLLALAEAAVPDGTERQVRAAARGCWQSLLRPCRPYRGRRRRAERYRELDRVPMMLAEGWVAWDHYDVRRTRQETADLMGLTPRQLRTREALLQRAIDHFGLDWKVKPAFRGRPPGRGWKPATGRGPLAVSRLGSDSLSAASSASCTKWTRWTSTSWIKLSVTPGPRRCCATSTRISTTTRRTSATRFAPWLISSIIVGHRAVSS